MEKAVLFIVYAVGACGFLMPGARPLMLLLTPYVLFLTGLYVALRTFYNTSPAERKKFTVWIMSIFMFTMLAEAMGVRYGLFFGEYLYGGALGPSVAGVPLIIGVNWMLIITGTTAVMMKRTRSLAVMSFFAALAALAFDIVMEPAAVELGFWEWHQGAIPFKNYVSWFFITFVFSAIAGRVKLDIPSKWAGEIVLAQFVFFAIVRISGILGFL